MKIYLVGGALRDELLGLAVKDRDWVVVGTTPEVMQQQGYQLVGKDFPVFLHPKSKEEYALARTERKTAPGYKGFTVHATPEVTLEEDLIRRDLTINAIARDEQGNLVDPFNGVADLKNRVLRHVSPAFVEDPVRVLRVARFAARFIEQGFTIADETMALMQQMVEAGEVDHLVPERVWAELSKALHEKNPVPFFAVLRECGALQKLFPEIDNLYGVPQPEKHHPEIDTGIHTMMVLQQAAKLSEEGEVRFAALVHDLGKGTTPEAEWPRHIAHEERGVPLVEKLCERFRVPKNYRELAVIVTRYHLHFHRAAEMRPDTLLKTLEKLDAFRRPERFQQWLLACEADSRGRTGFEDGYYEQVDIYQAVFKAAAVIDAKGLVEQGVKGEEIGKQLFELRVNAVKNIREKIPCNKKF